MPIKVTRYQSAPMIKGSIDALMRMQEAELKDARYERGALRWSHPMQLLLQ